MGEELIRAARENDGVCAITAGMPLGNRPAAFCGAVSLFFDVGICEQHALALAAGLAKGDAPVCGDIFNFLQRGLDQVFTIYVCRGCR